MSNVRSEIDEVGKWARLIVAKRVAIIATLTIIVNLALSNGWITPDLSDHALALTTSILDGLAGILAIAVLHPAVTPVIDPRDNAGNKLVPEVTLEPEIDPTVDDHTAVVEANGMNTAESLVPAPPVPPTVV